MCTKKSNEVWRGVRGRLTLKNRDAFGQDLHRLSPEVRRRLPIQEDTAWPGIIIHFVFVSLYLTFPDISVNILFLSLFH